MICLFDAYREWASGRGSVGAAAAEGRGEEASREGGEIFPLLCGIWTNINIWPLANLDLDVI